MDGPSHYREAERLVNAAVTAESPFGHLRAAELMSGAQVHALLALTAATTLQAAHEFYEIADDVEAWSRATNAAALNEDQADDPAHVDGALDRIAGHALAGAYLDQNGGAV
jgi:hypothetical protein